MEFSICEWLLKRKHNDDDVGDLLDSSHEFIDDLVSAKSEEGNKPKKQKKANFQDQMLELQQQQINAIKEADKKNHKFMKDLWICNEQTTWEKERGIEISLWAFRNCFTKD